MIDTSSVDAQAKTSFVCLLMQLDLRRLNEHGVAVGCCPLRRRLKS